MKKIVKLGALAALLILAAAVYFTGTITFEQIGIGLVASALVIT